MPGMSGSSLLVPSPAPPPSDAEGAALRQSLLDSRQRWRDFGLMAADLLFETDVAGRFTFLAPELVLGWPAATLLGRMAEDTLLDPQGGSVGSPGEVGRPPDPFRFAQPVRDHLVWVRDLGGRAACLSLSSRPLLDGSGGCIGTRGVAADVTARERQAAQAAAALRRGQVLDHIMSQMRQEVMAPRMMVAVLEATMRAVGASGAAVLDLSSDAPSGGAWPVLHAAGDDPALVLSDGLALLREQTDSVAADRTAHGLTVLGCPASTRFGDRAGLVVWRPAGRRAWDGDDHTLASSVTGVIRIVLEHETIQRELARQARTDPLTGLLNRRAFMDEARRRIDRLDREGLPGTLMFVDLDRLKPLNDRLGHEAGDEALVLVAELLRRTVRPSDLVARLGGDEFALWLDGSDELTAAERAEGLRTGCPRALAHLTLGETEGLTMSIGIACRAPGGGEELDSLLQRADQAMYSVKRAGRGHWRVSHTAPAP